MAIHARNQTQTAQKTVAAQPVMKSYQPIENYGIIGNLHTIALVGMNGSIDWCCMPHFDSPSVFAAILDGRKGGFFKISPTQETTNKQLYIPDTNVLLTRFLGEEGVGEVIDFMPIEEETQHDEKPHHHQIIRRVSCVRGEIHFRMVCRPAYNFARGQYRAKWVRGGAIFSSDRTCLGLISPVPLKPVDQGVVAEFTLKLGEQVIFVLRHGEDEQCQIALDQGFDGEKAFHETVAFWHQWLSESHYRGRWREMVHRSALTLKLLTFSPTGAIIAAPTTSLPEEIGGERNWDYRYTWLRDAAFTLYGLLRLGFTEAAGCFMQWLEKRCHELNPDGSLQIMYGINGEHKLKEEKLSHLEGYRGSRPVRVGNGAYKQLQLDIYGELMDSVYLYNKYGKPISEEFWNDLFQLLEYVCEHWQEPDEGIWEVRGGRRHFVYSKLMCWVALDRGLRLADKRGFSAPRERWSKVRDQIHQEIMKKGWNEKIKSFVQHYETEALDASNLIMPLVKFISPTDPRMLATLDKTLERLVSDSLVHRYQIGRGASDGLAGGEGTFSMCSFWLVECLTRAGRLSEARLIFSKMLSYANHLGLYAEEIGPCGEALGNFPQALTHLALISCAYNLDRALGAGGA